MLVKERSVLPETINIYSGSEDWRGRVLSNFAPSPFLIDGIRVMSFEGFYQGLKYPVLSELRQRAFSLYGLPAKRIGDNAPHSDHFQWNGRLYYVGSAQHHGLLKRALREKFMQHGPSQEALRSTGNAYLTHILPRFSNNEKVVFPSSLFCKMLMEIREEIKFKAWRRELD